MKRIFFMASIAVCVMVGCKSEPKDIQEEHKRIFQVESVGDASGLQQMQVSKIKQDIVCKDKKYQLIVEREPNPALPHVKSEMGVFLDNNISGRILRENGAKLFEKVFTKRDFANYLTEEYLASSVLEGLVFDDVKTGNKKTITLVASVSYPMTDLYTPFTIVISDAGNMTISNYEDEIEYTPIEQKEN